MKDLEITQEIEFQYHRRRGWLAGVATEADPKKNETGINDVINDIVDAAIGRMPTADGKLLRQETQAFVLAEAAVLKGRAAAAKEILRRFVSSPLTDVCGGCGGTGYYTWRTGEWERGDCCSEYLEHKLKQEGSVGASYRLEMAIRIVNRVCLYRDALFTRKEDVLFMVENLVSLAGEVAFYNEWANNLVYNQDWCVGPNKGAFHLACEAQKGAKEKARELFGRFEII